MTRDVDREAAPSLAGPPHRRRSPSASLIKTVTDARREGLLRRRVAGCLKEKDISGYVVERTLIQALYEWGELVICVVSGVVLQ